MIKRFLFRKSCRL